MLPAAVIYCVASRNLRNGPTESLATIADWYSREFDSLAWAAVWHVPPFVMLAIIVFFVSRHASRQWLAAVLSAGVVLITIPMVPRSIHLIKDTYRRNNWGEGAEYGHFFLCILSCACLCVGLYFLAAMRRTVLPMRMSHEPHTPNSTGNG